MTLFDVEELVGYWANHPPVHLMVAAYLGIKSEDRSPRGEPAATPMEMLALIPGMAQGPPLSAILGAGAVDEMRDMWAKFEAAKAGLARQQ